METKPQMLSNLIINPQQRLVFIVDGTGREKLAHRILCQLLREQGHEESTIKTLPLHDRLQEPETLLNFLCECVSQSKKQKPFNVILPTLADFTCYQRAPMLFEFLNELRDCAGVQRTMLWASTSHLISPKVDYLLAACEYMSDIVVHLRDSQNIRIISRKPGGGVTNKNYVYKIDKNEFVVESAISFSKKAQPATTTSMDVSPTMQTNPEHGSTFKIELEEEELVARNAMKLPYEKTSESDTGGGNIVYTPDAADDFDDEDPDEDLCI